MVRNDKNSHNKFTLMSYFVAIQLTMIGNSSMMLGSIWHNISTNMSPIHRLKLSYTIGFFSESVVHITFLYRYMSR